jgi:hypothetical protein
VPPVAPGVGSRARTLSAALESLAFPRL